MIAILLGNGVILGTGALVVDVGGMHVEREELQTGADAAVLAVAASCAQALCDTATGAANQWQTADRYADRNAKDGRSAVTSVCGNWGQLPPCAATTGKLSDCIGDAPVGNYVEVRVRTEVADGTTLLPPTFGRALLGRSAHQGATMAACARTSASVACVTTENATYRHIYNGAAGTLTVTADRPLCPGQQEPITLVSYVKKDAGTLASYPQYMYDYETATITSSTSSVSLDINVPYCNAQVDAVFRATPTNPLTATTTYGSTKLGDSSYPGNRSVGDRGWSQHNNGTCSPQPSVTFTSQCDGSMRVRLANGSTANIRATFTVIAGGVEQFVRVAAGASTTVTVPASRASQVTVEDNRYNWSAGSFGVRSANWVRPYGC